MNQGKDGYDYLGGEEDQGERHAFERACEMPRFGACK